MMMKKKDISVVLPVYNVEDYLQECLDSIIRQSDVLIEIIAVNDASTDSSLEILKKFNQEKHPIKIIDLEKNRGAGHARNIALAEAEGRYTIFVDSDDYLLPDSLGLLHNISNENNTDIVIFTYQIEQDNSNGIAPMFPTDREKWDSALSKPSISTLSDSLQFITINNYPWNKLYRTQFLQKEGIRFSETIVNNDIYAHWVSMMKARKIYLHDQPCYVHRLFNSRQQITNYFDERRFDLFQAIDDLEKFFNENPQYKSHFYHYFMVLKHDVFLWARGKMPERLAVSYNQKVIKSIMNMTVLDLLRNVKKSPSVYMGLIKIVLGRHPQFKVSSKHTD